MNNKSTLVVASLLIGVGLLCFGLLYFSAQQVHGEDYEAQTVECAENFSSTSERINCWMDVVRSAFEDVGTERAFEVFESLYTNYEDFATSGCHLQAHRMGDIAYYTSYLKHQDISKMEFPKNANACGYGFYHGFIEHLIQDSPDVAFAEEQCKYLVDNIIDVAPGIEGLCYHASGHGFLQARADELRNPAEWTIANFTTMPLEKCDALLTESAHNKAECRQGVFNVFVNWMEAGEYGFKYDPYTPYTYCDTLENIDHQDACYVEMTRKIEFASNLDPVKELEIIQTGNRTDLEESLFIIAVAGIIMHDPYGEHEELVERCRLVESDYQHACFTAIIHGLFEHGIPDAEYKLADLFCQSGFLTDEEANTCFDYMKTKLARFRTPQEVQYLCTEELLSDRTCAVWNEGNS